MRLIRLTQTLFAIGLLLQYLFCHGKQCGIDIFKSEDPIEGGNMTITCNSTNFGIYIFKITKVKNSLSSYAGLLNGACDKDGSLNDISMYSVSCGSNSVSVRILNVSRRRQNEQWSCISAIDIDCNISETVIINVRVPVKTVKIHPEANKSIMENTTKVFYCNTSFSRPTPSVIWYLQYSNENHSIAESSYKISNTSFDVDNYTSSSLSQLTLALNRSFNGWDLICEASNINGQNPVTAKLQLNITFPPDNPPMIIGGHLANGTYKVISSTHGKLSCVSQGGNPLPRLTWKCYNQSTDFSCQDNNTVVENITWMAAPSNKICYCKSIFMTNNTKETSIIIDVLYPPKIPNFEVNSTSVSGSVKVIEGKALTIKCNSSSNPEANVKWNLHLDKGFLQFAKVQREDTKNYTCNAVNTMRPSVGMQQNGTNTNSIEVDVLYPPNTPSFYYVTNSEEMSIINFSIRVIRQDTFKIRCHSTSKPESKYVWDDRNNEEYREFIKIEKSVNATCNATNTMNETVGEVRSACNESTLSITVLYPPEKPQIRYTNSHWNVTVGTKTLSVLENSSFNLTCTSESRPKPRYNWIVNGTVTNESEHGSLDAIQIPIKERKRLNCTCEAFNVMDKTFGEAKTGSATGNMFIDVLHPVELKQNLSNVSVVEGTNTSVTCAVLHGNPYKTYFVWTNSDGFKIKNEDVNVLPFSNVSRKNDSMYTCTIYNLMEPSYGNVTSFPRNTSFHLNVFFRAEVTNLSATGNISLSTVVINDGDRLSVKCDVEGNPLVVDNITLFHSEHTGINTTLNANSTSVHHERKHSMSLLYNVTKSSYVNAGIYACTGRNNVSIGNTSRREITVIVQGPPRPSNENSNHTIVYAKVCEKNVSLKFEAYPFVDAENKTFFSWFNGTSPLNDDDGEKISITKEGLKTALIIKNIVLTDFRHYTLNVNNSFGSYTHFYQINTKVKPDVPKDFIVVNESISVDSVKLSWKPGFDGGSKQIFILFYKIKGESDWKNISVDDTGHLQINYTVHNLQSDTHYCVKLRAENSEGHPDDSNILEFRTISPTNVTEKKSKSNIAAIVGGSVSVLVAFMVLFVVIWFIKNRKGKEPVTHVYQNVPFGVSLPTKKLELRKEHKRYEETPMEVVQDVDDISENQSENSGYYNCNSVLENLQRIKVNELFAFVSGRSKDTFEEEYLKFPKDLKMPCTFARKPENIALNRYKGILPYDHSRVKIDGQPDFFMNACYIDGYKRRNAYIASLGPTIKTSDNFINFWKMLWFQQSDIIVMLTNLNEPSGPKYDQYWPFNKTTQSYGDYNVSCEKEYIYAEYTVRLLIVSFNGQSRRVTHLHYTAWPDKKVPEDAATLLEFRQRIKTTQTADKGPVIVHGSAGIGRTGTLIALDRLVAEGQNEGFVDVITCVNSMREQRLNMVQTLDQYIYIHKALVCRLYFENDAIPLDRVHNYVHTLNNNTISEQFQNLKQYSAIQNETEEEIQTRVDNERLVTMNRRKADVPGNRYRIRLHLNKGIDDSDYINAVYVNSFRKADHFITAQSPLSNGVFDFISMIHQENCSCIVTMEDIQEPGLDVGIYLPPNGHTINIHTFTVSCKILGTKPEYIVREMRIQNNSQIGKKEHIAYHFHFTAWMNGHDTPRDVKPFVQFIKAVEEADEKIGEEDSRVLVHCLKASERSALFVVVSILLEKMQYEGHANVLNTVRHVRTRRREAITSMEQLKFCYQTIDYFTPKS